MVHQRYVHLVLQSTHCSRRIVYKCVWSGWMTVYISTWWLLMWLLIILDGTSTLRASGATRYSLQLSYRLQVRVILANNIYALDVTHITVAAFWMVIYRILHIRSYTTLFRFLWCLLLQPNHLQVIIYKLKLLGEHNWLMIVGNFSLILLYDDNLVAIMYKCVNNNTL